MYLGIRANSDTRLRDTSAQWSLITAHKNCHFTRSRSKLFRATFEQSQSEVYTNTYSRILADPVPRRIESPRRNIHRGTSVSISERLYENVSLAFIKRL